MGKDRKPSIINYFSAIAGNWFSIMSGGLSIPFAFAALYLQDPNIKLLFVILAICCLLIAPYIVWSKERKALIQAQIKLDEREKRRSIMDKLGEYLLNGQQICILNNAQNTPALIQEAEEWGGKVEKYLDGNLGISYVARFRDGSGLPLGMHQLSSIPHINVNSFMHVRLARLHLFIEECRD